MKQRHHLPRHWCLSPSLCWCSGRGCCCLLVRTPGFLEVPLVAGGTPWTHVRSRSYIEKLELWCIVFFRLRCFRDCWVNFGLLRLPKLICVVYQRIVPSCHLREYHETVSDWWQAEVCGMPFRGIFGSFVPKKCNRFHGPSKYRWRQKWVFQLEVPACTWYWL